LELTGLVSGVNYSYQYWVGNNTARKFTCFGKTADPYSTLVLSPYDDPYSISLLSNMPVYPAGQEREVTVLQTGQASYA
jgi:hypothetical protein